MRIINASGTDTISLGYPGENERTKVRFYYGDLKSEFPEGTLMLQVRRPGENNKYEVELEPDGYYAYWLVSEYDLVQEGTGECQLIYATTGPISKKKVWKTQIEKGIKGKNIGIPPTWQSIETRLLRAATNLQATIDETEERLDAAEERMDQVEQDVAAAQQAATDAASSATEAVNTAQQAIVDIQDATTAGVDTVNAEVIKAEGWAEGTQNGQQADEYADKSAKHWAEQASSSAAESASSASSAAASQASAASSESNAETYMRGAEQHKIGAETAAAEAESSATDAETAMAAAQAAQAAAEASRDSAAEFFDEVAASVSEAQRAEQEAEVAANDAEANALIAEGWAQGTQNGVPVADGEYYQNNAEYWAGIATDNAARTDTLASEALRSMQAAGVSETNAASYAAAANTSANNANASAAQAYQSEQNAALSLVNAQNSQSSARVSAEKAARSESAAAGSASTAEAAVNRYNNMSAVATTLEAEAEATASIDHSGSAPVLRLGIPKGNVGKQGEPGPQGVTFTPSVDGEGNLSWTNNGNIPNPPTVNIKGQPGEPGTSVEVHICGSAEYDENGMPTVENPDVNTFYLVPDANVDGQDMFVEWVNVDGSWEIFGSARVDLSNYVQKTDYASTSNAGVVRLGPGSGLSMEAGIILSIMGANKSEIKTGTNLTKPIVPHSQHQATFYGLAKAAGDTTQSQSDNAVGTYTDEAKAAIQQMLDVPSTSNIPDVSIYATKVDTVLETSLSRGRKADTAVGIGSFVFGNNAEASGDYSSAFGVSTKAPGQASSAEGVTTTAQGRAAHAEGWVTKANGNGSHAEGRYTIADGGYSHVSGQYNVVDSYDDWPEWTASTDYTIGDKVKVTTTENETMVVKGYICKTANSDSEFIPANWNQDFNMNFVEIIGNGTANDARSNARALDWDGNEHLMGDVYVHANADSSSGEKLIRESEVPVESGTGVGSVKTKDFKTYSNVASGDGSFAEGRSTLAIGEYSHTEGSSTVADGLSSHAENFQSHVRSDYSHGEGYSTVVYNGKASHSEGWYTVANGIASHTEGGGIFSVKLYLTGEENAINYSYTCTDLIPEIGNIIRLGKLIRKIIGVDKTNSTLSIDETFGEALVNKRSALYASGAFGNYSHAEGNGSIALCDNQHVQGAFNAKDINSVYADIIGNGTDNDARSNAYALDWSGNGHYMGDVYVHSNTDSSGGERLAKESELGLKVVRLI